MFIKRKKTWHIPESQATPEETFLNRRRFLKDAGMYGITAGAVLSGVNLFGLFEGRKKTGPVEIPKTPTSYLYPASRNPRFILDRPLTDENAAARYNNFYEFSTDKNVWMYSDSLILRPWQIEVTGLVERPRVYDIDTLVKEMPLEERLYRFRCVEAWAMAVPWTGFPMVELVKKVRPLSSAKYVLMRTFLNKGWSTEQRLKFWLPWPYQEGLTMEEATNELTFLATGIYGHELPKQHGAPLRLVVPWKYGFKSIKSIVRIEFVAGQPKTFWNTVGPDEYAFESNVNPLVPHPRWSQATEKMIDTKEVRPTLPYNGYGEYVAGMYVK
ncbi:MAG: protein-methionine-sulfoxide reductase catalytic subunit MsrP [Deltaproteobacteria bacterium]|nr:protein-methionine-sulfoxide reductase catalytic subunit MsrP [Deltaproteobacteria bacterium]